MKINNKINFAFGLILVLQFLFAGQSVLTANAQIINPLCPSGTCAGAISYNPATIIGLIINSALGFIGAVALVLFIWGGFKIMLSRGNPDDVKTGKNTMIWAVIGLILIFSSYAIVSYIINAVPKG